MPICVGCGLDVVDGILEVQVDPAGGLVCGPDGLAAEFPTPPTVPGVSPDACNGFELRGNGYYSPCPDSIVGNDIRPSINNGSLPFDAVGPDNFYAFESELITIQNTTCCAVEGLITIKAGGLYADLTAGSYGYSTMELSFDGAGYVSSGPATNTVVHNNGTGVLYTDLNGLLEQNRLGPIPAGVSYTIKARQTVTAQVGTLALHGAVVFEFVWVLPQTGCC